MPPNLSFRCLGLVLACTLAACAPQRPGDDAASTQTPEAAVAVDAGAPTPAPAEGGADGKAPAGVAGQLQSSVATYTDAQRKFILTASAEFQVRDVVHSSLAIEDLVAAHGGFVASNQITSPVDRVQSRSNGSG